MTIFGIDVSEHNDGFNIKRAVEQSGIDFVFIRTSDGRHFDKVFASHLQDAARTDAILAAYHYMRPTWFVSIEKQVETAMRNLKFNPKLPLVIDVEAEGIRRQDIIELRKAFEAQGIRVAGVYTGMWFWSKMEGSNEPWDDLGLLWLSHYGRNLPGDIKTIYPGDTSDRWNSMVSNTFPSILQYSDRAIVQPNTHMYVDANAFRGTKEQLRKLLYGEDASMEEKRLIFDTRYISQDTYYNCGPASVQTVIMASTGVLIQESVLAQALHTTSNGTNWWPNPFVQVLDHYLPGSNYEVVSTQQYLNVDEERLMFDRMKSSIDCGLACIVNIVSPPDNRPRAVFPSTQSPNYGRGQILHYFTVTGYRIEADGTKKLHIVDSGFDVKEYWITLHNLATLMVPRGYIYSTNRPKEVARMKVPSWINPKVEFEEHIALANIDALNWENNRLLKKMFDKVFEDEGVTHSDFLREQIELDRAA